MLGVQVSLLSPSRSFLKGAYSTCTFSAHPSVPPYVANKDNNSKHHHGLLGIKPLPPEAIITTEAIATGLLAVRCTFLLTRVFFDDSIPAPLDKGGKAFSR